MTCPNCHKEHWTVAVNRQGVCSICLSAQARTALLKVNPKT